MGRLELKVPPVLVVMISAAVMWLVARATPSVTFGFAHRELLAGLFVALGLMFAGTGLIAFRQARTTVDPRKPEAASSIVHTGIYQWTRNPMYLGFLLMLAGWGFWLSNGVAFIVLPLFVAYMNRFQIIPEERALRRRFGAQYDAYAAVVRRWI